MTLDRTAARFAYPRLAAMSGGQHDRFIGLPAAEQARCILAAVRQDADPEIDIDEWDFIIAAIAETDAGLWPRDPEDPHHPRGITINDPPAVRQWCRANLSGPYYVCGLLLLATCCDDADWTRLLTVP
jgi:hypothetical protein